jgi:hypothetical protein
MTTLRVAEPRLAVVDARLNAAERALRSRPTDSAAADVTVLLTHVASDLADMAAAADTGTAAKLTTLRSDVSGHLLAAATLESAGAPTSATVAMLRRATLAARTGLEATYGGPLSLLVGA